MMVEEQKVVEEMEKLEEDGVSGICGRRKERKGDEEAVVLEVKKQAGGGGSVGAGGVGGVTDALGVVVQWGGLDRHTYTSWGGGIQT